MRAARRFALSVALLVPLSITGSTLAPAAAHALAAPTVVITSPAAGTTVTDLVGVGVTSTTDPTGTDYPWSTSLYVDGTLVSGPQICNSPVGAKTCAQSHLWASDAKNGTFTLQVVMTTELGTTVSSPTVTVIAKNPPPTVSITSPSEGAAVAGLDVTVDAAGLLDPSQRFDYGGNLFLDVDGTQVTSYLCGFNPSSNSCSGSLVWNTSGATAGHHTLTVRFTTVYGGKATSAPVHVTLAADSNSPIPTTVTLSPGGTVRRWSPGVVHGTVVTRATGDPVSGAQVTVVMSPTNATSETITVLTDSHGAFTATASLPLPANTAVVASVTPAYGSASASASIGVTVPITCHVPAFAHRNASVTITCTAPDLAYDSVLALHVAAGIPHETEYGKVQYGSVTFTTSFSHPQQLTVWGTTATTRTFTASRSASSVITVS